MKIQKLCIMAASLALGLAATAASLKQDTQEFRVDGHFDPETSSGGEFEVGLTYGYVLQDNLEVGGRLNFSDNDDVSLFSLGGFAEYNFELESDVLPFVGVELSYISGDTGIENNSAAAISGYAGARYFLTDNVAIGAQLRLSAASDDVYASDNGGAEGTDVTVLFGMSYFLPPN